MNRPTPTLVLGLALFPFSGWAAETTTTRPRLSERLSREIRAALPSYDSQEAEAGRTGSDPSAIPLPKVQVRERPFPRIGGEMLTPAERSRKRLREYKNSMTGLNGVLNGFSIPFVGPSMAARAEADYQRRKSAAEMTNLLEIIQVSKSVDPHEASEMRKELTGAPDRRSLRRKK